MITSGQIKKLIPGWLTDGEIDRLRREFDPVMPASAFKNKRWIRMYKRRAEVGWERAFDCPFFDSQLRLYVFTNPSDTEILHHEFVTE